MKWFDSPKKELVILGFVIGVLLTKPGISSASEGEPPIANAGLSRYAAREPVMLDGTGSYDPDDSGILSYAWQQLSGPPVKIGGADTASPEISGFVQTNEIQECEFELVVSDGELTSLPDSVKIIIVPDFGASTLRLENDSFDPYKPTIIFFGGGDGIVGLAGPPWDPGPAWRDRANLIDFPSGYTPDTGTTTRTFYKYGDMIIAYLSAAAPDYRQAIQTIGMSSGVDPALDVGIRLNEVYQDARYAVNRVTELDGLVRILEGGTTLPVPEAVRGIVAGTLTPQDVNLAAGWSWWLESLQRYLVSSVGGEQCWIDFCYGTLTSPFVEPPPRRDILWVRTALDHASVYYWYLNSLTGTDTNRFNNGLVAGAYWSVIGSGKNLQLASVPGAYYFRWNGGTYNGVMDFLSQSEYPGRLPEPVTLLDFQDSLLPKDDLNGVILTCKESQNAVGYQLLSGSDPYDVTSYHLVVDGNSPPAVPIAELPSSDTWWTIKVRDAYGSTIHADPTRVGLPVGVIAYWTLDEVEGSIAHDSVGNNHGAAYGEPLWQPAGGKKDGALQFDGMDDYVTTDFVLNPADDPFSVFAWIQGGAPGDAIISQTDGAIAGNGETWLGTEPVTGTLMTGLVPPPAGRFITPPLKSQSVVTDGQWHHIGFVWDGAYRSLHIDGAEVAKDTAAQKPLQSTTGGLYIGAGKTLDATSFFSGLIDDIRIYNRAVRP